MKFSVIIPAHNSMKHEYFRKCLSSVHDQEYPNDDYELIVVCDACDDNTHEVASEYANKVIDVDFRNDGLARDAGLDAAEGEWVLFLDDDDWWVHEYVLASLERKISTCPGDMGCLQFAFVWKGVGHTLLINNSGLPVNLWSKCFKRSYIGDTRTAERAYPGADAVLCNKILENGRGSIVLWDNALYYYNFMRPGSITATERSKDAEISE